MREVLPTMFQRAALLSLSLVLRLYKFEEDTALLFWGKVFRYLSLCVFKSDTRTEKKNETKERASAARDARENGGDEWPRGERTRRGEKKKKTARTTGFVDGVV